MEELSNFLSLPNTKGRNIIAAIENRNERNIIGDIEPSADLIIANVPPQITVVNNSAYSPLLILSINYTPIYSLSLVYPNDLSIFSSDRHLALTFTLNSRNTGRSRNFSISIRAFSPSLLIASPLLPIIIPFWLSLSTTISALITSFLFSCSLKSAINTSVLYGI